MRARILVGLSYVVIALMVVGLVRTFWPRVETKTTVEWKVDTNKVAFLNGLLVEANARLADAEYEAVAMGQMADSASSAAIFYKRLADSLAKAKPGSPIHVPVAKLDTLVTKVETIFNPIKPGEMLLTTTYVDTISASYVFPPVNRMTVKLGLMPRIYPYAFPEVKTTEVRYETRWQNWAGGIASAALFGYGLGTHDALAETIGACSLAFFLVLGLFG